MPSTIFVHTIVYGLTNKKLDVKVSLGKEQMEEW